VEEVLRGNEKKDGGKDKDLWDKARKKRGEENWREEEERDRGGGGEGDR